MIKMNQPSPTKPGLYMYGYLNEAILIHVYRAPITYNGGLRLGGYLAVSEYNGHPVEKLIGNFSSQLTIKKDVYGESMLVESEE